MVVCLNTGMHTASSTTPMDYYQYSCGTGVEAGRWFVEKQVKVVAMDMQRPSTIRSTRRWARTARRR